MRASLLSLLLVLGLCANAAAQGLFGCTAGTSGSTDPRAEMKMRPAATDRVATPVTIQDVLRWPVPSGQVVGTSGSIDPREDKAFMLTGYVRRATVSSDDCDLRLELAASTASDAPRMIAEIPMNEPQAQQRAAEALGLTDKLQSRSFEARQAPKVTVTGFGFLDSDRPSSDASPSVQTLWELHPVWMFAVSKSK
jgi:hypothetical protein